MYGDCNPSAGTRMRPARSSIIKCRARYSCQTLASSIYPGPDYVVLGDSRQSCRIQRRQPSSMMRPSCHRKPISSALHSGHWMKVWIGDGVLSSGQRTTANSAAEMPANGISHPIGVSQSQFIRSHWRISHSLPETWVTSRSGILSTVRVTVAQPFLPE